MADLYSTFSSLIDRLKPKPRPEPSVENPTPANTVPEEPLISASQLQAFDDRQLADFTFQQPERTLTRILHSLENDQSLQLRVVQSISEESTLKRISRSQVNKKVKRAAEKKLRETGSLGMELKTQKLAPLNEKMQAFFRKPEWANAHELLSAVSAPGLVDESIDLSSALFSHFQELRDRLKREVDAYELTCTELEEISLKLDPSQSLSKSALETLQNRWNELSERYPFQKDSGVFKKYEAALTARSTQPMTITRASVAQEFSPKPLISPPTEESRAAQEAIAQNKKKLKDEQEQKEQAARQSRLATVENLRARLLDVKENLAHRHAGQELRKVKSETAALQRWRREYPTQLVELETLLKNLTARHSEVIEEAKWDTWARTDLAIRIQTQLEKLIGELEAEQDPVIALKASVGLTGQLLEYAKEMKALGGLERGKDHEIWKKFKSLSDRGWAVCARMRLIVLEGFKSILSEHASKPIEFTAQALSNSREPIHFKDTAFTGDVPAQIKELRSLWIEIGTGNAPANLEFETVFTKLFENYSRQMNLKLGREQRVENSAVQIKQDLLKEMQIACEGKSTLISRAQVARKIEEKWRQTPMPTTVAAQFDNEFEGYQNRINAELTTVVQKHTEQLAAIETQVNELLQKMITTSGSALSHVLKTVSKFESEILAMDKQLGQLQGLKPAHPGSSDALEASRHSFQESRAHILKQIQECRTVVTKETRERAEERDRVLREAEELALSTDWETSRARFEELKAVWTKSGALGQDQDSTFGLLFVNVCAFYFGRYENKDWLPDPDQKAKYLKTRKELIYSLEALTRFRGPKTSETKATPAVSLPFSDEEIRMSASGKLLEFGMKYNHILSLDPASGTIKETKKIMDQWAKLKVADDESLAAFWKYYLDRAHTLLEIGRDS